MSTSLHVVEQALGVPMKRFERPMLGFLSREEMLAVIGKPGPSWTSQRDHLLLAHALQHRRAGVGDHRRARGRCRARRRGLRAPARQGTQAADDAAVAIDGQGGPSLVAAEPELRADIGAAAQPGRPCDDARPTSRSGWPWPWRRQPRRCRACADRRISPHTIRHTTAMHLLQSGVDINVIALWLGHESPTTTHQYVEADLAMKEKALARLQEPDTRCGATAPPTRCWSS